MPEQAQVKLIEVFLEPEKSPERMNALALAAQSHRCIRCSEYYVE